MICQLSGEFEDCLSNELDDWICENFPDLNEELIEFYTDDLWDRITSFISNTLEDKVEEIKEAREEN